MTGVRISPVQTPAQPSRQATKKILRSPVLPRRLPSLYLVVAGLRASNLRRFSSAMADSTPTPLDEQCVRAVLRQLLEGHELAASADRPTWEFAVEIATLAPLNVSHSQLRWLIAAGLAEAQRETTTDAAQQRTFKRLSSLTLPERSCLVLTELGLTRAREVGAAADSAPTGDERRSGRFPATTALPRWDAERRCLYFNRQLVKAFRVPAPNQEAVLAAFEQSGWPACVENPLGHRDPDRKERLQQTIRALNRSRVRGLVRFRGDGRGTGVCWEPIPGRKQPIVPASNRSRTLIDHKNRP
jgi:hypothetical protein